MNCSPSTINGKYICVFDTLLSADECREFIALLDSPEKLSIQDRGIALYDRGLFISDEWANRISNRIRHALPLQSLPENICINNHFRFSKYHDGGYFAMHQDGMNQNSQGYRTLFTVNIFLNDNEYEGGETDFFYDDKKTLTLRAIPKAGRGVVFHREIYHAGNLVKNGTKYLIRTDVMIRDY